MGGGNKVGILYRDFYDVPRMFIVHYQGRQILFDCKFDENADEYSETFKVYLLPDLGEEVLKGTWDNLSESASRFLGEVAVKDVTFDPSLRKEIDTSILDNLINRASKEQVVIASWGVNLGRIISDLEQLNSDLRDPSPPWVSFRSAWWPLEEVYAVALSEERATLDAASENIVKTSLDRLDSLIDSAHKGQNVRPPSDDHRRVSKFRNILAVGIDEIFLRTDSSGAWSLLLDGLGSSLSLTDGTGAIQTEYATERLVSPPPAAATTTTRPSTPDER